MTVYLLPHSHIDIGYTHLQTDVIAGSAITSIRRWN